VSSCRSIFFTCLAQTLSHHRTQGTKLLDNASQGRCWLVHTQSTALDFDGLGLGPSRGRPHVRIQCL